MREALFWWLIWINCEYVSRSYMTLYGWQDEKKKNEKNITTKNNKQQQQQNLSFGGLSQSSLVDVVIRVL